MSSSAIPPAAAGPDPREVAKSFMRTELGMVDPAAGNSTDTGQDTVEVQVRPGSLGDGGVQAPVTTVTLKRTADGFVVAGARTDQIVLDAPAPDQSVGSPVAVTGKASAFEGSVQVQVRQQAGGGDRVLGEAMVQGSGTATLGPFSGEVGYSGAAPGPGWLALFVSSESDGQVIQATVIPVQLA